MPCALPRALLASAFLLLVPARLAPPLVRLPLPRKPTNLAPPPPKIKKKVGMAAMDCYERDFEEPLLAESGAYYRRRAAEWVAEDSCPDYMAKAEGCLRAEEERVEHYLHASTRPKLLREAEEELLAKYQARCVCVCVVVGWGGGA